MEKRQFSPVTTYPTNGNLISPSFDLAAAPSLSPEEFGQIHTELGLPFTSIDIDLPYCLHLEDGLYPVKTAQYLSIVKLQKTERKEILYIGGEGHQVEMPRDPRGLFRYTHAAVCFSEAWPNSLLQDDPINAIDRLMEHLSRSALRRLSADTIPKILSKPLPDEKLVRIHNMSSKELADRVLQIARSCSQEQVAKMLGELRILVYSRRVHLILNRLIDVYRSTTNSYYLPSLGLTDFILLNLRHYLPDGAVRRAAVVRYPNGVTLSVPDRSVDEHSRLWDVLAAGEELPVEQQMFHTAQRYLLNEQYSAAIIEAFSAFEVAVGRVLTGLLLSRGQSLAEAQAYLEGDRNWMVTVRVKDIFPVLAGVDVTSNPVYLRWVAAKSLRDEIVHSGRRSVSDEDAEDAIDAISEMARLVQAAHLHS